MSCPSSQSFLILLSLLLSSDVTAFVITAVIPAVIPNPPPVDFSGYWSMDLGSSDRLKPLLRELGVPRLLCSLLERLAVSQEIGLGEDSSFFNFKVITKFKTDQFSLPAQDCDEEDKRLLPSPTGGKAEARTIWVSCGEKGYGLETTQKLKEGLSEVVFVTTRTLEDEGDVLVELCKVLRNGEETSRCRRVLRRTAMRKA
ncbi:hypothetical protein TrRE_jg6475 [Triparma retinervis]|uniref:Uncharacterized protein n=1 Tax=Triparma retinervis TaxID=2557542 RepID=A0A9W7E9Y7_9STRA|nr:hypothetical protein TrRE_jg6475 [Triparma retinervis]